MKAMIEAIDPNENHDDDEGLAQRVKAEVDTAARLSMSLIQQLAERGMRPALAATAMAGAAAKIMRLILGPDIAAEAVRHLADEVEADRGRFDA